MEANPDSDFIYKPPPPLSYLKKVPDGLQRQPFQLPVLLCGKAVAGQRQLPQLEEHPLVEGEVVVVEEVGGEDGPELGGGGSVLRAAVAVPPEEVLFRSALLHKAVTWKKFTKFRVLRIWIRRIRMCFGPPGSGSGSISQMDPDPSIIKQK
jgi:hypothetical protein